MPPQNAFLLGVLDNPPPPNINKQRWTLMIHKKTSKKPLGASTEPKKETKRNVPPFQQTCSKGSHAEPRHATHTNTHETHTTSTQQHTRLLACRDQTHNNITKNAAQGFLPRIKNKSPPRSTNSYRSCFPTTPQSTDWLIFLTEVISTYLSHLNPYTTDPPMHLPIPLTPWWSDFFSNR